MGFQRTTASSAGFDASGVVDFIDTCQSRGFDLHSLMVAVDGQVVAEGWAAPYRPDGIQLVYSCSKSLVATAAGFLVTDGRLDVATKVLDHLPWHELCTDRADVDPRWEDLRLEHCLSMTVGHDEDAWGPVAQEFTPETDFIDTILAHPPTHRPGTVFCYNQVATYLAVRVIEDVAGEPVLDLLRRRFFEPLDAGPVQTHTDSRGRAVGFTGFHVRTEALLALAQLYLDEGRWAGQQLLSREWVEFARTPRGAADYCPDPNAEAAGDWDFGYGHGFWMASRGYRGDGVFGQFALVLPQQRLAIAITSETGDMQGVLDAVWAHILPAVGRGGSAESDAELADRLATLSLLRAPAAVPVELPEPLNAARAAGGPNAISGAFDRAVLDGADGRWVLTLQERGRSHDVPVAATWQRTTLDFGATKMPVATLGGWTSEDQFVADIVAVETPHRFRVCLDRSTGEFTAAFHLTPLSGSDPAVMGVSGTGGRSWHTS